MRQAPRTQRQRDSLSGLRPGSVICQRFWHTQVSFQGRWAGQLSSHLCTVTSNPAAQDGADLGDTIGELQMLLSD